MGLDMYANAVNTADIAENVSIDFEIADTVAQTQFMYWRKHHDLHGFMEELYNQKGGEKEFNCVNLRLREADLDELEKALKEKALPSTAGFFFGNNPPDEDSLKEDLKFVKNCRSAILEGNAVIYHAWY